MNLKQAIEHAFDNKKVKSCYPAVDIRRWRSRLNKGKLSTDWQMKFLQLHGYTIKTEQAWLKPPPERAKPKGAEQYPLTPDEMIGKPNNYYK